MSDYGPPDNAPNQPPPIPQWWDDEVLDPDGAVLPPPPAPPGPHPRRKWVVAAVLAVVLVAVLGAAWMAGLFGASEGQPVAAPSPGPSETSEPSSPETSPTGPSPTEPSDLSPTLAGPALEAARGLEVKGRAQVNDYDRALFGQAWLDVDRNGCDTRNDILRRDLQDVVLKPDTNGCAVLTGTLVDPYAGQTIDFVQGEDTSQAVQIDHVVPLADAWQKGAREWTDDQRAAFANDPLNLLAVDGAVNQAKGAGDAATWLPPDRDYWCPYAARIVAVKTSYGLWVTSAEGNALIGILEDCPDEPLPTAGP